jgi:putative permease
MKHIFTNWLQRNLSNPEAFVLLFILVLGILILETMGHMLAPVFASIIIAYLLTRPVNLLTRYHVPHRIAVLSVYLLFLGLVCLGIFKILPILWQQLTNLLNELPNMFTRGQALLMHLPEQFPNYLSMDQLQTVLNESKGLLAKSGQFIIALSLASIPGIMAIVVYAVLVPLLVYFFLMDKKCITQWLTQFMPDNRRLAKQVWDEVYEMIGNYVRGKVIEVLIVWVVSYITFMLMGLPYAMLLAASVGLSCIIPYIGAVVVTIPIVIIALLQWGWSPHFAYLMIAYALIIIIDGNVLVPVLFAEAVKLHPIAIILAVVVFAGIWGFWGVFFAIPLASLVKAVINAWPRRDMVKTL